MKNLLVLFIFITPTLVFSQNNYMNVKAEDSLKQFTNSDIHTVKSIPKKSFKSKHPKNIILFIGDGMGTTQIWSGITANQGHTNLENFTAIGFSKTQSGSHYTTDSGAGGTAIATGKKTYNGAIGVAMDSTPIKSMLEIAEYNNKATGLVSTSSITHATPASFIAHNISRNNYEEIATDFLNTEFEVIIGGGKNNFTSRKDGRNLCDELKNKGYEICFDIDSVNRLSGEKLVCLTADAHNPRAHLRNNLLEKATTISIERLNGNNNGFFLMVEGSQIDWGGHQNNTQYIVEEFLDIDKAIGVALEFAIKDGETLIIVTADHETGGMAVSDGNLSDGYVNANYTTGGHTAVMVPVFAYGPGAEKFIGIYENTDIFYKVLSSFGFSAPETKTPSTPLAKD